MEEQENPVKPEYLAGSIRDLDPGGMAGGNWDSISFTPSLSSWKGRPALSSFPGKTLWSPLLNSRDLTKILEISGRTFLLQWEVLLGNRDELWDNPMSAPHPVG